MHSIISQPHTSLLTHAGHSRTYLASSQPTVYISSLALRPLRTAPADCAWCDLEDSQHSISSLTHDPRTPTL